MRDVTALLVSLLTFLMGRASEIEPCRVSCSGTRCFSVFLQATDFAAAQDRCGDMGGHLMTVQSSAIEKILHILVGDLTGRYWIGLHLATSCPDPDAELRGFDWVPGGIKSEYTHWSAAFDGNCSSPRCVCVSKENNFTWVQEPCANHMPGILCEHGPSDPCQPLTDAPGDSVTYTPPVGFSDAVGRSMPAGSIAVRISAETKYFCLAGKWHPAPRSCGTHEGGTPEPTDNVPYTVAGTCNPGFELAQDGMSCVDIDDCADERKCTGKNFMCVDSVGGFHCACKDGYKSRNDRCVDVDECASAPCEHLCVNTPGSYECSCFPGYKKDANHPQKCALFCGKEECAAECDPNNRFQCNCPDGYVSDERSGGTVCLDIDECSSDSCDQLCQNTFGSYVCACSPGYTLVSEYQCVKNPGGTGQEPEGSAEATSPSFPTTTAAARPEPTRRPSRVSAGGLAGITVCTVLFVLLVLFVVHRILSARAQKEGTSAQFAAGDEGRLKL